ncbi:MAG: hypothetical protein AAGA30_12855, partial [Planctomycetota bacterium]
MIRKHKWFWIVLVFLVLVFISIQVPWGSNVERPILRTLKLSSDEVPRTPLGNIDFIKIQDESYRLPPEQNQLAEFVQILGCQNTPGSWLHDSIYEALGIDPNIEPIETLETYVGGSGKYTDIETECLQYLSKPWRGEQFPEVEQWLADYKEAINRLEQASNRIGYYHPYLIENRD